MNVPLKFKWDRIYTDINQRDKMNSQSFMRSNRKTSATWQCQDEKPHSKSLLDFNRMQTTSIIANGLKSSC